ncbi:rod shape-determining protein RodA [bacterium]|nr:rod shape-determining protein RodA [bacterium]
MSNPNYNMEQDNQKIFYSSYDSTLVFIVLFLIIVGFLAIFSAGAPKCIIQGAHSTFFVARQFIWFILGCIFMFGFSKFNYKALNKLSIPFAWLIIFLLFCVHVWGTTVNGATRWLTVGPIQFQPSEAAKLSVIMLLASAFSKDINLANKKMYKYYIPIVFMLGLIFKQPNLSMCMILAASSLYMYYAAGGSLKLIASMIGMGFFGLCFAIRSFQKQRVMIWLNPESDPYGAGYNIIQSMICFVAGGFFGEGYGNSIQKRGWLPEGHTDFIYAVWAEEFGFLGCLLIIGLFLAFLQRGLLISAKCEDVFGKLLSAGITVSICIQAYINISVASSMFPATGVPMPFISYGGTSLFITMCMIGILLNISKKRVRRFPNVQ